MSAILSKLRQIKKQNTKVPFKNIVTDRSNKQHTVAERTTVAKVINFAICPQNNLKFDILSANLAENYLDSKEMNIVSA